jgi:hypothetical protein
MDVLRIRFFMLLPLAFLGYGIDLIFSAARRRCFPKLGYRFSKLGSVRRYDGVHER